MKSTVTILFSIVLTFAAETVSAQPADSPFRVLHQLADFVGEWEGRYDPPGGVPEGIVHVECRWMGNKTYLFYEVTFRPDNSDVVLNPMNVIIGYNGKTSSAHAWQLKIGAQASTPATISKNKLVMKGGEEFDVAGTRQSRTVVYELRSPDEFVATNTDIKRDGRPQPDEEPVVMKRIK